MAEEFRILCLGDVVARPGRVALSKHLPSLRKELGADLVIANAENSAGGAGVDPKCAEEIFRSGVDLMTLGDHTWRRGEVEKVFAQYQGRVVRPGNYPGQHAGAGYLTYSLSALGMKLGLVNLLGRVFMGGSLDCPFQTFERMLEDSDLSSCDILICDLHAEATSEKLAFLRKFHDRLTILFGTHSHVPTADHGVTEGGVGFVSDLGMCGSQAGIIGMDTAKALERFLTGAPNAYKPAKGSEELQGVVFSLSGKVVQSAERIFVSHSGAIDRMQGRLHA